MTTAPTPAGAGAFIAAEGHCCGFEPLTDLRQHGGHDLLPLPLRGFVDRLRPHLGDAACDEARRFGPSFLGDGDFVFLGSVKHLPRDPRRVPADAVKHWLASLPLCGDLCLTADNRAAAFARVRNVKPFNLAVALDEEGRRCDDINPALCQRRRDLTSDDSSRYGVHADVDKSVCDPRQEHVEDAVAIRLVLIAAVRDG
jgi:hypothetical protein